MAEKEKKQPRIKIFNDKYLSLIGLLLFLGLVVFVASITKNEKFSGETTKEVNDILTIKYVLQSENTLILKNLTQVMDLCQCKNYCTECNTKLVIKKSR